MERVIGVVCVKQGDSVVMKIATYSGAENASKVASRLEQLGRVPTVSEANKIASSCHFGCRRTRMVISRKSSLRARKKISPELAYALAGFEDQNSFPFVGELDIVHISDVTF